MAAVVKVSPDRLLLVKDNRTFVNKDIVSVQAVPGYNATVPIELNFTSATPCWFNLRPGTIAGFGENTPSFNIIGQERDSGRRVFGPPLASTTSALPSTTPTPRSSASTTEAATSGYDRAWELGASSTTNPDTSATTAANSASTATSTPDTNGSGLSVTVAAGIGAGVAFGVLAIAGGVFAWLWRARRRRRAQDEHFHYKNDQLRSTSGREKEVIVGGTQVVLANSGRGKQDQYLGFEQRAFELSSAHMPAEIASSQSQYAEREIPRGMPLSPTDDGR